MKTSIISFIGLVAVFLASHTLYAQSVEIYPDSLLKQAQNSIKGGDFASGQKVCLSLLKDNPDNLDARIILANCYLWKKSFTEARPHLDTLLLKDENNYDVLTANLNWYYWSSDYVGSLNQANRALLKFPQDLNFKLKKAQSLKYLEDYTQAKQMVDTILLNNPDNGEAQKLHQALFNLSSKNKLTLSYVYDYYEDDIISPTHLAYVEYARKINKHTLIGRVNYGNRFSIEGVQYESDLYLKTTKNAYLYLNLGYSPSVIFPEYRAGAEWYQSFGKGNEASLGLRYLYFNPKHVFIYTASYGKYFGPWWLQGRTYLSTINEDVSVSGLLTLRRYCTKFNYIGLQLNSGINPDVKANLIDPVNNYFLNSTGVRLEYSTQFLTRWIAQFDLVYENQEYLTNTYRNVISFDVRLSYLF